MSVQRDRKLITFSMDFMRFRLQACLYLLKIIVKKCYFLLHFLQTLHTLCLDHLHQKHKPKCVRKCLNYTSEISEIIFKVWDQHDLKYR